MQSLRYKVGASYLVLVLIGVATSIFAVYSFTRLRDVVGPILQETHQSAVASENLTRTLERQEVAQLNALIDEKNWDLYRAYYNDARSEFLRWLDKTRQRIRDPQQEAVFDNILATYRLYLPASDSLFLLLARPKTNAMAVRYQTAVIRPLVEQLKSQCFILLEENQEAMAHAEAVVQETTWSANIAVLGAVIASIIASLATSIQFTRSIIKPAERLTSSVRKIAQGRLNQKIDVTTDDEIGELSREFNKMTERLREFEELNVHQLIAEKRTSETIVANIVDPILVVDEGDRLILMNQAAEGVLELRDGDWHGRPLRDVLRDERWASGLTSEGIANAERDRRELLLQVHRSSGTLYFRPRHARIVDEQGRVQGRVTLLQDVTRFKDLADLKSEFVATVSHELRTPLTSLSMGIDILGKEVVGAINDRQREIITATKDDCERLRKLVKDLLDLSKLESGKMEMAKDPVSVRQLVDDAIRPLRLPFEEKHVVLEIDVPKGLPDVLGDEHQLAWVVTNLLSNAWRFTDAGGRVALRASRNGGELLVAVSDTGRGIPLDQQERIFEQFVQVKAPDESTPGSVGLGLSIARAVVESHGGRIWVESVPGAGSTFTFVLPFKSS